MRSPRVLFDVTQLLGTAERAIQLGFGNASMHGSRR